MHIATISNLTKSFGVRKLFSDITFHIEKGDRIALVARNGFGKSTLLHIMAGVDHADSGTVWIHKDFPIVFLNQESTLNEELDVWDNILSISHDKIFAIKNYEKLISQNSIDEKAMQQAIEEMDRLNAWNLEADLKQILDKLKINHLTQNVSSMSGGQKKRIALAKTLLTINFYENKCMLLLDEPTNHLDIEMIEWLEQYLLNKSLTLLMVTHDRYFLDAVCNEIIEIEDNKLYIHKGDYTHFIEQKAHRIEVAHSESLKDKNIYRRELEWMRKQPKARTTKSKYRQDQFSELENKVKDQSSFAELDMEVKMNRIGGKILEMKKVYKSYDDLVLLKGFDYTFSKGERVGIIGKNGVGKSTFIKIALQLMPPDSGKINHGDTIVFGYFSQEPLQYKEDKRVIEFVKDIAEFFPMADGTKISASSFLEKFAFTPEQHYTYLSKLSGGEKRRLQLLSILYKNPNFLVLDEPTNDLDLQTLQILENFLINYPGCLLIISHDRYFMDKLVQHLFVFEGEGRISDFPGNYAQYKINMQNEKKDTDTKAYAKPENVESKKQKENVKMSYKEKREWEHINEQMPILEAERTQVSNQLSDTHNDYKAILSLTEKLNQLNEQLENMEMRWLELSEKENI